MGVVFLDKEFFGKVRVLNKTYYQDIKGKMQFVEPSKDPKKPTELIVGSDITIEIGRKLVQSQKCAAVYDKGKKPKEA